MKLLHCISAPSIGGIERLVIELAMLQRKNGIETTLMVDSCEGLYYDYLIDHGVPIVDSGVKKGFDFNMKTYANLKQQFSTFDVIHLHNFTPLRSAAAHASKAKTVYTIHGLSKGIRQEGKLKTMIRESIKTYFLNRVDVFIANSEFTLALAKKHYQLNTTKHLCILNGIKLPENTHQTTVTSEGFTIGLVSRFTKRKRVDRLVNAFKQFKEKGGKAKLMLVGDGAEFQSIQNLIKEQSLTDSVELTGYVTNVEEYYQQFDLCVFPSEEEPFGLVAVEAYLKGKAVLAFKDSGGLKEVIEPLEPQSIVKDVSELAERLLYWSKQKEALLQNADKRRAYAVQNFSLERMAEDYAKVYRQLI